MIYVCGRRMSQPLSSSVDSSLWQPGDNALIRLPADCREGKKERNNHSSSPAWGLWVNGEGGELSYSSCFIVPSLSHHPGRQLWVGRLSSARKTTCKQEDKCQSVKRPLTVRKALNTLRVHELSCTLQKLIQPCFFVLSSWREIHNVGKYLYGRNASQLPFQVIYPPQYLIANSSCFYRSVHNVSAVIILLLSISPLHFLILWFMSYALF